MERTKIAISEVCRELKERAKEAGLNIIVKKQQVVPNRKTRIRRSEKLAIMIMPLKLLGIWIPRSYNQ